MSFRRRHFETVKGNGYVYKLIYCPIRDYYPSLRLTNNHWRWFIFREAQSCGSFETKKSALSYIGAKSE